MKKYRSLEVLFTDLDESGNSGRVWGCKWSRGGNAKVFTGNVDKADLNLKAQAILKCPENMTDNEFYEWAENVLMEFQEIEQPHSIGTTFLHI